MLAGKGGSLDHALLATLIFATYLVLFLFRAADDNALTSWRWVFAASDVARGLMLVIASLSSAFLLARIPWPARHRAALLFLISFTCAAAFWSEPEVIVDAARYFTQAKHLELYGVRYFFQEWGKGIQAWTDLPVVPFLYGLIFYLFGESRLYVQILTTALFAGTAVLTYHIGRRLWGEEMGFRAGCLLLGTPYLFTQVPLMLVDVPTMFLFTLALMAFLRALDEGGIWMTILAPVSLFLALFSKYSTWPLLSLLIIATLVRALGATGPSEARSYLARGAVTALAALLPAGAAVLSKPEVFVAQMDLLRGYQWAGLRRWEEGLLSTLMFQTSPLVTAAAISSLPLAVRDRDWRYAILCWPVLTLLLMDVHRIRYMLPVFPLISLMAAHGLQAVETPGLRRFLVLSAVLPSLAIGIFAYLPFLHRTSAVNLQHAADFLKAIGAERVEVFTLPPPDGMVNPAVAVPILDLFTDSEIVYRPSSMPRPAPEELARSSLRFTWELRNPGYYGPDNKGQGDAVVVVAGAHFPVSMPPEVAARIGTLSGSQAYSTAGDPYRYKTMVTVYHRVNRGMP